MSYIKLNFVDNWGEKYFIPKGCPKKRVIFKEGQQAHIKWPDNSVTEEIIFIKIYQEEVQDMGVFWTASGELPYIIPGQNLKMKFEARIEDEDLEKILFNEYVHSLNYGS